ncbi:MAG: LD-carboxypeptidase [Actinomycetota bacterium]|nr:LD-carboxypeptidase [Actinomycetota bacterium]
MQPVTKPPRLRPGDTVGIVSPASGAVGRNPHRTRRGLAYLESLGLGVRLLPNAARNEGWTSAPPEARADDIHAAFADDEIAVVLSGTGGNCANQLLPLLDYDLIGSHPKIFQGYSDITVLQWAITKNTGLSTFYGPALVPELGEYPEVLPYTDRYLRDAWFAADPISYEPSDQWTDEFLDWNTELDLTRPRELRESDGWIAIRGGAASGWLLGGCLEAVCWHLKGSRSWIEPDGALLFLETSGEANTPAVVDAYLTDMEQLGVFDAAAAMIFGRPYGYTDADAAALWDVVARRTEAAALPVLGNVDAGHTDPMLTLPIGCRAHVDVDAKQFRLLEPATAD